MCSPNIKTVYPPQYFNPRRTVGFRLVIHCLFQWVCSWLCMLIQHSADDEALRWLLLVVYITDSRIIHRCQINKIAILSILHLYYNTQLWIKIVHWIFKSVVPISKSLKSWVFLWSQWWLELSSSFSMKF